MGATFHQRGWDNTTVRVNKGELLKVLCDNRTEHRLEYEAACTGYRAQALKRIDEVFKDLRYTFEGLKEGQTVAMVGITFDLDVPEDHTAAYDQIIQMMEMSVDDVIELTASQFACFVRDDWEWKEHWTFSNSKYLGK